MARRKKKRKKLVGHKRVFFKMHKDSAHIYVAMDTLENVFGGIMHFNTHSLKQWNLLAVGAVYWNESYGTYYGTSSKVQNDYCGQGHGDFLYKAMLLAASELANKTKKRKVYFSPHAAVGVSTSASAWRCYKSLARKGYLKSINGNVLTSGTKFEVVKLPKCINPIILKVE